MRATEFIVEAPLPPDWDPSAMQQRNTSFKSRLQYALDRAKKIGTGSSRVATVIDYEGRPTVLKIAKNIKGLAQNNVEADILSDGYARQLNILIPIIDYDEQNREPSWIHTEMATKATEKQLCNIIKCDNLSQLINMAWAITGKKKYVGNYESYASHLRERGKSEEDIDTMTEYANTLADLNSNFDVEFGTNEAGQGPGSGADTLIRVPVRYGDASRQAQTILQNNSANDMPSTPLMTFYVTDLKYDRPRMQEPNFINNIAVRQRTWDTDTQSYETTQGNAFTIERLMPVPFMLTINLDIWTSNTNQKMQLLEQILVLFNPALEIQSTDNYIDWTSLTVCNLEDVNWTSRTVPVGTENPIDIATLTSSAVDSMVKVSETVFTKSRSLAS